MCKANYEADADYLQDIHSSQRMRSRTKSISDLAEPAQSSIVQFSTYFIYVCAVLLGLWYDLVDLILRRNRRRAPEGYAPVVKGFDSFYSRHLYVIS